MAFGGERGSFGVAPPRRAGRAILWIPPLKGKDIVRGGILKIPAADWQKDAVVGRQISDHYFAVCVETPNC